MDDKELLNFTYRGGYFNANDSVEIPEGALIVPSSNVIYNKRGRPISVKDLTLIGSYGGSRAFTLDSSLVGFLGIDNTSNVGIGNMFQGVGKNLWFVGNSLNDSVKAYSSYPSSPTAMQIGGTNQVETVTVTAGAGASGTISFEINGVNVGGGGVALNCPVLIGDSATVVATKMLVVIQADTTLDDDYFATRSSASISITDKELRANDVTLSITLDDADGTGVTFGASTNTAAGALDTAANLSTTPQLAKWNGTGWNTPVQVGLAVQDDAPQLVLTTDSTRDAYFDGILTGSTSARLARKRNGTVSIASGASNIVTGDTDSVYVLIPDYPEDGSLQSERIWVLYFTYKGKGSLASHFMFPIEIPESKLDGSDALGWTSTQGNARIKVIEQHASNIANRKIEVEFYDNDLLLLQPYDDYFSAGACKFIRPLGNVMCLIGSGTDSTAFDVSFPNFREAYPPDWRDWFSEVPVSVADASEQGMLWILTANTTYQAIWTGATQETAPVILRQVTSKYGAIGAGASISVNGTLYFLSKGKTPIRISPDGEGDINFGNNVINAFSTFDSTTQVGFDEANNSIVWACGSTIITFQIDGQLWGSLGTLSAPSIDAFFNLSGVLYATGYASSAYKSYSYNTGTGTLAWNATGAFQTGKSWLNLKDIIESRVVVEADAQPYTITVEAYKNFVASNPASMYTYTPTVTTVSISPRVLLEKRDYESISIKTSGTKGGQSVHNASIIVDIHGIEREGT